MMIAFSVASETRCSKHAYAMRARVRSGPHLLVCLLLLLARVQGRTEEDEQEELSTEDTTETATERNANRRMTNINSLSNYCELHRELANCRGFRFGDVDEVAFFELPTQVRIAPDGATYELDGAQPLSRIVVENSTFANFPLHLFYELPLLSEVDMRQCSMQIVSWECFLAASKLQVLLLSNNALVELGERTFTYASELKFLFLAENLLNSLHARAFEALSQLSHLDLSSNQLEELPDELFRDLKMLHYLTLANNRLRVISDKLLLANPSLQTLILEGNQLRTLGEYALSSPKRLLFVDISHNGPLQELVLNINAGHLQARNCSLFRVNIFGTVQNVDLGDNRVEELYFSEPEALEDLVLRNNSLVQLATLSRVPRLQRLNVANNPQLRQLPDDWHNLHLERLDLSNTGLEQLPSAVLRGMPQLRKLNVSFNNISEIDPQHFVHLSQLSHFFIHENNWNCYSLRRVMDMLILQHGITYSPDKMKADFPGTYIHDIACMYRLPEREQLSADSAPDSSELASASVEQSQLSEPNELAKLRQEFKAVVQHFEAKFDNLYEQLSNLNAKINNFERINSSLWNQMTILV